MSAHPWKSRKSSANIPRLPWSASVAGVNICESWPNRTKRGGKCTLRLITEDARFFIIKSGGNGTQNRKKWRGDLAEIVAITWGKQKVFPTALWKNI